MNPVVIIETRSECTSQFHQDWRDTDNHIVGVFTDPDLLELALLRQPKSWREQNPDKKYATEGDVSITWEIYDDIVPNRLSLGE